jgi:hypothetical protein
MLSPVSITVICVQLFPGFDWAYRLHQSLDTEAQQQRDAINTSQLRETGGQESSNLACAVWEALRWDEKNGRSK